MSEFLTQADSQAIEFRFQYVSMHDKEGTRCFRVPSGIFVGAKSALMQILSGEHRFQGLIAYNTHAPLSQNRDVKA